jgi:hypothetical protein
MFVLAIKQLSCSQGNAICHSCCCCCRPLPPLLVLRLLLLLLNG